MKEKRDLKLAPTHVRVRVCKPAFDPGHNQAIRTSGLMAVRKPTKSAACKKPSKKHLSYAAREKLTGVPAKTLWRRDHGGRTRQERAVERQYLTPCEEKALVPFVLRYAYFGYPLPVKALRFLAAIIKSRRNSNSNTLSSDDQVKPPGPKWPQGFYKRHPEVKARRVKPLDWARHDHNIHGKIVHWFDIMEKEMRNVRPENIYNMDETGVQLANLRALKVLLGRDALKKIRGAGVNRELITVIECIRADGGSLSPYVIWPAASHRSNWTLHPTPGWHFDHTKTGYTNATINLQWLQRVFEPQTAPRAQGQPRILITDGFATHETADVLEFCLAHNIIPCRLPSHTSHKTQPCDVGPFGPLKATYREAAEEAMRLGLPSVGKSYFTLWYDKARQRAFTPRNILAGWARAGLRPFDRDRVLRDVEPPPARDRPAPCLTIDPSLLAPDEALKTPVTAVAVRSLRVKIERQVKDLPPKVRHEFEKFANAAEGKTAHCDLLEYKAAMLEEQNKEKVRRSGPNLELGRGKVMSWEDLEIARARKAEAAAKKRHSRRSTNRVVEIRSVEEELRASRVEIAKSGLEAYCSVLEL